MGSAAVFKKINYLWNRKKIVQTMGKSLSSWLVHEAGRSFAKPDCKTLVFVQRSARSRSHNHALSMRCRGWQCILVAQAFSYDYQKEAFEEIHPWLRIGDIPRIVEKLSRRCQVHAVIGSLQPSALAQKLLGMDRAWPVLLDHHDSAWSQAYYQNLNLDESSLVSPWLSHREIDGEREVFRSVDGVIARSPEIVHLLTEHRVETPVKVFEDCACEGAFQEILDTGASKDRDWSVVYAGICYPMSRDPRYFQPQFVPWGPLFESERIHFHIYPSPHHEYDYADYERECDRNPYFHLHRSVDFGEIQRELSKYDFGLVDFSHPMDNYKMFSKFHSQFHLHAKFFTYWEAGLPIIAPTFYGRIASLIRENGGGWVTELLSPAGLRKSIESLDVQRLRRDVAVARVKFSEKSQGTRLVEFVEEVCAGYQRSRQCR